MTVRFTATDTDTGISLTEALIEATDRAEDLLCLWQEHRRLEHHLHYASIRFEDLGIEDEVVDDLANDVADWRQIVEAFAQTRGRLP